MNDKLKPCPFCGSPAELIYNLDGEDIAACSNKGGNCHNVSAYGVYLNEWQRRPIEDALEARVAELEESDKHWAGNVKVCMQLIERYESDIAELEEFIGKLIEAGESEDSPMPAVWLELVNDWKEREG